MEQEKNIQKGLVNISKEIAKLSKDQISEEKQLDQLTQLKKFNQLHGVLNFKKYSGRDNERFRFFDKNFFDNPAPCHYFHKIVAIKEKTQKPVCKETRLDPLNYP